MGMAKSGNPVLIDGGYLTIPASTQLITVNHNLGTIPNFAAIWVDGTDYDIIPFGCCVECIYQKNPYVTTGDYKDTATFKYMYQYKHSTSGNLLSGTYALGDNRIPTGNEFYFLRGTVDWASTDTNGDPLHYRWVVGYLPITD